MSSKDGFLRTEGIKILSRRDKGLPPPPASLTPPGKEERNRKYKGHLELDNSGEAVASLKHGKKTLPKKEFKQLANKAKKMYNIKSEGRIINVVNGRQPRTLSVLNKSISATEVNELNISDTALSSEEVVKQIQLEPSNDGCQKPQEDKLVMSLFDRVVQQEMDDQHAMHKLSGKSGRYAALKAKRAKEKLGHGDDKKMGAKDAGAPMAKANEKHKAYGESKHEGGEGEEQEAGNGMKARMANLRAMKGKKPGKKDKKMDYDNNDEMEEGIDEGSYEGESTRKQSSGDSDNFFAWSQKRKPKSLKVRPKGSSWDYNPVPVHPDVNHGKVKIEDEENEETEGLQDRASQLDTVAESLEKLKNSIFG